MPPVHLSILCFTSIVCIFVQPLSIPNSVLYSTAPSFIMQCLTVCPSTVRASNVRYFVCPLFASSYSSVHPLFHSSISHCLSGHRLHIHCSRLRTAPSLDFTLFIYHSRCPFCTSFAFIVSFWEGTLEKGRFFTLCFWFSFPSVLFWVFQRLPLCFLAVFFPCDFKACLTKGLKKPCIWRSWDKILCT